MKTILNILRGILGLIFFLVLIILLVLTPTLISTGIIISHKENPKSWLANSGIYEELPGIISKTITGDGTKDEHGKTKVVDKTLQKLVNKIVTKEYVSSNVGLVIDGAYDWLSGKTPNLVVRTDGLKLSEILKNVVPTDQAEAAAFLGGLKPCTEQQAYKYEQAGGFSDAKEMCIPPRLNLVSVATNAYNQSTAEKTAVSFDLGMKIDANSYMYAKLIFTVLFHIAYILTGVLVFIAALYLLIFPGKYFKLYMLGFFTIGIGVINYIVAKSTFILSLIVSVIPADFSVGDFPIKYATLQSLIEEVLGSFFRVYATASLVIAIVGGAIFLTTLIINIIVSASNNKSKKPDDPKPVPPTEQTHSK
ncbi:hypothetical protein M0R04_03420 [Candidatus Dojkabacteria bacterium]|jgi:hypothetical protein|nr:hypothetical protein [Candidatus Dojkabacteria bacterium]